MIDLSTFSNIYKAEFTNQRNFFATYGSIAISISIENIEMSTQTLFNPRLTKAFFCNRLVKRYLMALAKCCRFGIKIVKTKSNNLFKRCSSMIASIKFVYTVFANADHEKTKPRIIMFISQMHVGANLRYLLL